MTVCAIGSRPPPPMPCSARAAIRNQIEGAVRAGDRADDEDRNRRQHHGAAAVNVGELAEQRRRRGRRKQIGGHHPGQVVDAAETFADGRQRRRDNGLLQRREEHGQHDAENDGARLGLIDRRGPLPAWRMAGDRR